jgi:hypothetical protein
VGYRDGGVQPERRQAVEERLALSDLKRKYGGTWRQCWPGCAAAEELSGSGACKLAAEQRSCWRIGELAASSPRGAGSQRAWPGSGG